jgi:hypothetical protein
MSTTHAAIGILYPDGEVSAVFCNFDGYPEHCGKILSKHYANYDKVEVLMDRGDLVSIAPEINDTNEANGCVFYRRDKDYRGKDSAYSAQSFPDKQSFFKEFGDCVDYFYLYNTRSTKKVKWETYGFQEKIVRIREN